MLWFMRNRAVYHKLRKNILDSMTSPEIKHMKKMCIIDDSAVQDCLSKTFSQFTAIVLAAPNC